MQLLDLPPVAILGIEPIGFDRTADRGIKRKMGIADGDRDGCGVVHGVIIVFTP